MIRRIRDLLYDQGFTISGARNKLHEIVQTERERRKAGEVMLEGLEVLEEGDSDFPADVLDSDFHDGAVALDAGANRVPIMQLRRELFEIRELLALSA